MTTLTYKPEARVTILTGKSDSATPTEIEQLFTIECTHTLAPAVGSATIIFADPSGVFKNLFKPNDIVKIYMGSPTGIATSPSWTGIIDRCTEYKDPTNQYGPSCLITASTFWKWFNINPVPLGYFLTGQYPTANLTLTDIITTAISFVKLNNNYSIEQLFSTLPNEATTPSWTVPDDFINPQYQSWASFLGSMVITTGVEVFFNENGSLVIRPTNYAQPFIDQTINDYEIFKSQNIVSDENLVTIAVVTYSAVPNTPLAAVSPPNGFVDTNPLDFVPPDLGTAYRIGKRFTLQTIPFISDPGVANYYAGIIHAMGLANVNFIDITTCIHGDVKLGTIINFPFWNKKYYVTMVSHRWYFGRLAETQITGCFGINTNDTWNDIFRQATPLNIPDAYNTSNLVIPTPDCYYRNSTNQANYTGDTYYRLPTVTNTINYYDVQNILSNYGSPLASLQIWDENRNVSAASYIWTQSINNKVDPAFVLAVWTQESGLGRAVTNYNLWGATTSAGVLTYPDYKTSMDAFFADISSPTYTSTQTISEFFAVYNPQNAVSETILVTQKTLAYRSDSMAPAPSGCTDVTNNPPQTTWDYTKPSGWPLPSAYSLNALLQPFGETHLRNEPTTPPYGFKYDPGYYNFHYGIDISCPDGTPLYAVMNGTINAGHSNPYQTYNFSPYGDYGYLITITNGPYVVKYGHCQDFSLSPSLVNGGQVSAGDFIGRSDTTGNAGNTPHLHFEIDTPHSYNPVNPLSLCTPQ